MKSQALVPYILVVAGMFAWAEYRSSSVNQLVEHLYYLVPICFCSTFGIVLGWAQRLQAKVERLERELSKRDTAERKPPLAP